MKNRIFLISLLMLMFSVGFVMAANTVTLNTPAAAASISGATYVINGTLDTNTNFFTNATFYYCIDNAGTCTDWITIGTVTNLTVAQLNYTMAWNTIAIVDTMNITVNVTITDVTGTNLTEDTSITVSIDNGNPTATPASTSLAATTQLYSDTVFTLALDADNTIGIENCTAYFTLANDSVYSGTVTAAAEACSIATYTPASFGLPVGVFSYVIQATDDNGDSVNSTSRADVSVYGTTTIGGAGGEPSIIESVDTSVDTTVGVGNGGVGAPSEGVFSRIGSSIVNFFEFLADKIIFWK